MTREEAIHHLQTYSTTNGSGMTTDKQHEEAKRIAIEALEQQSCEDCISRADVEQTVEDNILCYTHSDRPIDQDPDTDCHMAIRIALRMLRKDLRKLPPVTPQPKVGHWVDNHTTCDKCGWQMIDDVMESPNIVFFNYCPACGARMIEPQESEDKE